MSADFSEPRPSEDGEIDVFKLIAMLWQAKGLIALVTVVCIALALTYAFMATPIFKADVLLEPAGDDAKKGGAMAQLGGLAAMAGINIGGGGTSKDAAIAKLKSRIFIEEFIRDENLLPVLFEEHWDAAAKGWKEQDPKKQPSLFQGVEMFQKSLLKIMEDKKTGLVTLTLEWKDAKQTAQWANLLVERVNRHLRGLAIEEARRNIDYLNGELAKAMILELKQVIASLTEDQIKKIMLANGRLEFAFKVIDPAVVPERRIWPKRAMIVVLGSVGGVILGVMAVFMRHGWRARKERLASITP
ncbi:hypothetical protein SIID45300_00532 [Candidatus Magnetaquicoccaceae bacterium FCR-1]|uniref:Lipopolysaccharide biosynthesis protein n=2 Tax=Candidatus Magnetaquiglobus chichijimensis TaxID=3141448 RepID=A0ABQ0C5Q9_9PROT